MDCLTKELYFGGEPVRRRRTKEESDEGQRD
jgi:hypothetical protein